MTVTHHQSGTSLYTTLCGLEKQYEKGHTSQYLEDITCGNCLRTRLFNAFKRLAKQAKVIEQNK